MRLIDADALLKRNCGNLVDGIYYTSCEECQADGEVCGLEIDAEEIRNAPTVDAVEVVRCKDCKHSEHWYGDKRLCHLWSETGIDVFEDGYCSYGERREDVQITDNN